MPAPVNAASLCLLALAACGEPPAPLLAELSSFHGRVAVSTADGTGFTGELAFDRANGNLQLTVRGPAQTVASSRRPGGGVVVFRDGVPAAPTAAEIARFALLERLVDARPAAAVEIVRGADGYTLTDAAGSTTVRIVEVFGDGVHGGR